MSGDNFLSRWAQRKQAVRQAEAVEAKTKAEPALPAAEAEGAIDPATLPPIETLTAESDFSIFLAKGVPAGLRQAALRKLWLTEPSVLEYKPLVEYNWDFTAPGYGDLLPTDDIKKLVQQILPDEPREEQQQGEPSPETSAEPLPAEAAPGDADIGNDIVTGTGSLRIAPLPPEAPVAEAAEQTVEPAEAAPLPPRRRHGGALPA